MDEEGVPSTTLREVSLLKMLSESNHIVKCVGGAGAMCFLEARGAADSWSCKGADMPPYPTEPLSFLSFFDQAVDGRARGRERQGLPLPGEPCPHGPHAAPSVCLNRLPSLVTRRILLSPPALSSPPAVAAPHLQVFEYLTMDMKRFMDRNGKGPAHPLPTATIKVGRGALGDRWLQPAALPRTRLHV
jgi:hypothetical protein